MTQARLCSLTAPAVAKSRGWWVAVVLVLIALPCQAQAPDWFYMSYKEQIPLELDTDNIVVFDPTPTPVTLGGKRWVPTPKGPALPGDNLGGGWTLVDLSGGPSAGDPAAMVALVESISEDPADDRFASLVFGADTFSRAVTPLVHAGFLQGVPLSTVEVLLQNAGVGSILRSDWIQANIFRVDGASRSGIDVLDAANALAWSPTSSSPPSTG